MDYQKITKKDNVSYTTIYYDGTYVGKSYVDRCRIYSTVTEVTVGFTDGMGKVEAAYLFHEGCVAYRYDEQGIISFVKTFYDCESAAIAWWYETTALISSISQDKQTKRAKRKYTPRRTTKRVMKSGIAHPNYPKNRLAIQTYHHGCFVSYEAETMYFNSQREAAEWLADVTGEPISRNDIYNALRWRGGKLGWGTRTIATVSYERPC